MLLIPTVVARFVSADQQQGRTNGIECIQDANRTCISLYPQLPQGDIRPPYVGRVWISERRPELLKKSHNAVNVVLRRFCKGHPPRLKLIRVLNCPFCTHAWKYSIFPITTSIPAGFWKLKFRARARREMWLRGTSFFAICEVASMRREITVRNGQDPIPSQPRHRMQSPCHHAK